MYGFRLALRLIVLAAVIGLLVGCTPVRQRSEAATSNATQATPATVVTLFNPESIGVEQQEPVSGECAASLLLPRPGAYQCVTEKGATLDPCFFLVEGQQLGCQPNPVQGRYAALVKPTSALPDTGESETPLPFYLQLDGNKPPCAKGVASPLTFDGQPVTYSCEAPNAWILGTVHTEDPAWSADYIVTDTGNQTVTFGPEPTFVIEAWVY